MSNLFFIGPTACSGPWRSVRCLLRSSITCCREQNINGPVQPLATKEKYMKKIAWLLALSLSLLAQADSAYSFCGFYVAKADTKIFNKASQVVLARQDDKTVITMVNDFKGDPKEFAVVIPVPTLIERGQINVGDKKVIDHLDAYTSPRLVEYFDGSPCQLRAMQERPMSLGALSSADAKRSRADALGVTIQAQYTVGEYDIVILSAKQ